MRLDSEYLVLKLLKIKIILLNKPWINLQLFLKDILIYLIWKLKLPGITEKDKEDILFGIKHSISYVSLSFARSAKDSLNFREFLYKNQSAHVKIIARRLKPRVIRQFIWNY